MKNLLRNTVRSARAFGRNVWRLASSGLARHERPAGQNQRSHVAQLRHAVEQLPPLGLSAGSATPAWRGFAAELRADLSKRNPDSFLRWNVIADTMFVFHAPYILTELRYLKTRSDWVTRWRAAIRENVVGSPTPYLWYPPSSGNAIHHAYHLAVFEAKTSTAITDYDVIVEFGGGYGSLCRLAHKLGFKGTYIIYDLPELSALQTYYLSALGLRTTTDVAEAIAEKSIACCSDLDELRLLTEDPLRGSRILFIATWSLSESPPAVRERLKDLCRDSAAQLIAYQHVFRGIDNAAFFATWADELPLFTWCHEEISHLPHNSYLIGYRPPVSPPALHHNASETLSR